LLGLVERDLGILLVALGIGVGHAIAEGLVGRRIVGIAARRGARVTRWSEDAGVALNLALDHCVGALEGGADHLLGELRARARELLLAVRDHLHLQTRDRRGGCRRREENRQSPGQRSIRHGLPLSRSTKLCGDPATRAPSLAREMTREGYGSVT